MWLEGERRHLLTLAADVLREAALGNLAAGNDAGEAVRVAERVLQLAPFDENAAVLLVRALREAGRASEAITVAEATAVRIRAELGVEPSAALWSAAHAPMVRSVGGGGRTAIAAQLEAGEAALSAGIPDAGLDALREALEGPLSARRWAIPVDLRHRSEEPREVPGNEAQHRQGRPTVPRSGCLGCHRAVPRLTGCAESHTLHTRYAPRSRVRPPRGDLGSAASRALQPGPTGPSWEPFLAAGARHVADHVPNAMLREIAGAGHAVPLAHPEALAEALTDFFSPPQQPI